MTPVYDRGGRVTHYGHPASVVHGNVPDDWGSPVTVNIRYDRAPRGHSPQKDVPASECTPARGLKTGDLAALRASLLAAGWSAESPAVLDAEGERLAAEEKLTEA